MTTGATVPAADARRLLLSGAALCDDPSRRATTATVRRTVERLGFVQIDTINVVARAHHHILMTRLDGYRPQMLTRLLECDRSLFEHWTHDASVIRTDWYDWWRLRFDRYKAKVAMRGSWFHEQLGTDRKKVLAHVLERLTDEGALKSSDFVDPDARGGPWWGWKPQKAALEALWYTGVAAIAARDGFQKVYDLAGRVLPDVVDGEPPDADAHVDWACREAIDRLGCATPKELAEYLAAVSTADAKRWCANATRDGVVKPVSIESADGSAPRGGVALLTWRSRAKRTPDASRIRLLNPFDPLVRDRDRIRKLFDFDYRFEAYVPAPKRKYGYYVMVLLEGDRLVGRLDAKHHRDRDEFEVRGVWWEAGARPSRDRKRKLDNAVELYAQQVGATHVAFA